MAARRILSLIAAKMPPNLIPREVSRNFHPSPNSFSRSSAPYTTGFQSIPESRIQPVQNQAEQENCNSISTNPGGTSICISDSENNQTSPIKHQVISNLKISERHDHVMIFTCKVCEARSFKSLCRESYDKGVVVARCDGCGNLHLIADRLGWFGEPGCVEDFLAARGEEVKKGSTDALSLTLEDLAGKKEI